MAFSVPTEEAWLREFVATVLRRFHYFRLAKGQRGVLFAYMQRLTGYSRQHLSRLIGQYLAQQAASVSDNDAALQVQKARKRLFQSINRRSKLAA